MASMSFKAKKNGAHLNQTKPNRFFKIILDPHDYIRLKLPKSFLRNWGENLPNKVTLQAPNGTIRKVDLVHCDGGTWLHKGFQEFKEYYSIELGHVLVFEYDGNSHFDLLVFDTTTTEIEYPVDNVNDPEGIVIRGAGKMPIKMEYESESESDDSPEIFRGFRSELKGKGKCNEVKGQLSKYYEKVRSNVDTESSIAYQRAAAFKSINLFFVKLMLRSHVTPPSVMEIPFTFAREHLCGKRNALELKIWVHHEKTWGVRCCIGNNRATLTAGWKNFVKDNALKVGDACVFEVDNSDMSSWKVTIFPAEILNLP